VRDFRDLAAGSDISAQIKPAQSFAQVIDRTRCDIGGFRTALIGSAQQCQKMIRLLELDSGFAQSLAGAFSELALQCMDLERNLNNLVSQFDRNLNLVQRIRCPSSTNLIYSAHG
jgi:hypothetical protein